MDIMNFHMKFNGENVGEIEDWLEINGFSNKLTLSQIGEESLLSLDDYGIIIYKGEKLIKVNGQVEVHKIEDVIFPDSHIEAWEETARMPFILGVLITITALAINFATGITILWWPPIIVGSICSVVSFLFINSATRIDLLKDKIEDMQERNRSRHYGNN